MPFASYKHLCAFFNALANVGLHTLILLLVDHRPDGGFQIGGIAGRKSGDSVDERPLDFVEAAFRHKESGSRDTRLTTVHKPNREGIWDGLFEVGILKQNVG